MHEMGTAHLPHPVLPLQNLLLLLFLWLMLPQPNCWDICMSQVHARYTLLSNFVLWAVPPARNGIPPRTYVAGSLTCLLWVFAPMSPSRTPCPNTTVLPSLPHFS